MSIIQIEITDDNEFNEGWLMYLLGLDRPADDDASPAANGWDMGRETGELKQVRHVFTRQHDIDRPAYIVRMAEPQTPPLKQPETVDPRVTVKPKVVVVGE